MTETRLCPQCGMEWPAGVLEGLCPKCIRKIHCGLDADGRLVSSPADSEWPSPPAEPEGADGPVLAPAPGSEPGDDMEGAGTSPSEVTLTGSREMQVICEGCGHEYQYTMRRSATAEGVEEARQRLDVLLSARGQSRLSAN
jgi:hypothetical protein